MNQEELPFESGFNPKKTVPNEQIVNFELPENHYKLNFPKLIPYKYNELDSTPSNEFSDLHNRIVRALEKYHYQWDQPTPKIYKDNFYKFELPPTNFQIEGQIDCINLPQYKFHSERERLNSAQLKEIWRNRSFHVKSEMENLPHFWKISSWLLHSSKEKYIFLKKILATCLRLFYAIPNVVNPCSDRVIRVNCIESLIRPNIFNVFVNFLGIFLNLWDFFFGFKFRTLQSDYENIAHENICKRAFLQLCLRKENFKENYKFSTSLKQYDNENEKQNDKKKGTLQKILEIERNFQSSFEEEMKTELNKEDFEEEEIESIKEAIQKTKQEKLYAFIETLKINDPNPIYTILLKKIKAFQIYQACLLEKNEKISSEKKKISEIIEKERSIYFLIGYKRERLINTLLSPIQQSIEKDFITSLENELKDNSLDEELNLLKNFQNFQKEEHNLLLDEIKEMHKYCLVPVNKFTIKYPLFASQYKKVKRNNYWLLEKEDSITIYSNFMFYKVVKAFASYFIKLYSLMFNIFAWIWEGPFGIKCLFLCSEFYTDYSINPEGIVEKNCQKVRPILRCFLGVIHGIQKSRKNFENAPDDGFFGKNFGRILNILYCVFVRFWFAGVLIVLLLHSILNILCIIGGTLAAVTTLIWLILVELILLLWKFLIYDYKSTLRHHSWNYYDKKIDFYEYPHLKLLRSYKWFTLLHLLWVFIFNVIIQFLIVNIMIILAPIISVLVFVVGVLLYILKSIWDWLILNIIIRCFARVPSRNSTFAYRVSGPGISRDFYNTLESKDLTLLIISHLERLELDQISKEANLILDYPEIFIQNKYKILFHEVITEISTNEYMKDSFKNLIFLKTSLSFYIDQRKAHLPSIRGGHHTIRFTADQLEKNEILIENLLKEFIAEKNMDRYIWDRYDLRKGLYKRLTRKILQEVLCGEAIEPVEHIDHVEKVKFAQQTTNFNDFITKFVDDKNENYQIMKEKRAYLQKLKEKNQVGRFNVYVDVHTVLNNFLYFSSCYKHPFIFPIVAERSVRTWNKNEKKEQIELNDLKVLIK